MGISMKGTPDCIKRRKSTTPSSTPLDPNRTMSQGIAAKSVDSVILEDTVVTDVVKSPALNITAEIACQKIRDSEKLMLELTLPWQEKLEQSMGNLSDEGINCYEEETTSLIEQKDLLLNCVNKWKDYRYNGLRDSLYDNAVLLKEANSISLELRQQVAFQFVLMTDCPYAHLPKTLALAQDCETEKNENSTYSDSAFLKKTIVAVEVSDATHGVTHIWSLEKLKQRINAMHEMCEASVKLETISPRVKACQLDDRSTDSVSAGNGNNPFFDPFPWYNLIGRSYVYLTHMLIPITLEQTVAIVTDRGDVVGHIDVLLALCEDEDEETKDCKATTVAFDKTDSAWYPKYIPVYPYRQNDLIAQCYLGDEKLTELIERPRKIAREIREQPPGSLKNRPSLQDSQTSEDPSREGSEMMSSSDFYSGTSSFFESSEVSAPHLKIGKYVRVKVKIIRVRNLDKNCANILLQNRFLYENQDPYSSDIYANDSQSCEVNHLHVYRIKITLPFLEYVKTQGFMIEVFGHYEQHPLHFESTSSEYEYQGDRRISDTIPPVKSTAPSRPGLAVPYQNLSSAMVVAKYDLTMNLQICELSLQGDYIPVPVTHVRETNESFFLLQHGLQRRLVLSFVYDSNIELKMKVREVVVGRIRNQLKPTPEDENSSLTLNVSSADYIHLSKDRRTVFRIQAAWDTSLHHTKLLNIITPSSFLVHSTMSVYLEMENCTQPACFTINFSLQITTRQQQRSGSRFWDMLFPSQHRPETNCVVGLYEVVLHSTENNAKRTTILDNQSMYVAGEEIIYKHKKQVKLLRERDQVERTKHVLSLPPGELNSGRSVQSSFLRENLTEEDLLKKYNSMKNRVQTRSCVPFVHDISKI